MLIILHTYTAICWLQIYFRLEFFMPFVPDFWPQLFKRGFKSVLRESFPTFLDHFHHVLLVGAGTIGNINSLTYATDSHMYLLCSKICTRTYLLVMPSVWAMSSFSSVMHFLAPAVVRCVRTPPINWVKSKQHYFYCKCVCRSVPDFRYWLS